MSTARIVIVGRGRLGSALARALRDAALEVEQTAGRRPSFARLREADIVVLAVADPHLARVAASVRPALAPRAVLLHASGSLGPEILRGPPAARLAVGVMHPLVSFASRTRAPTLSGTSFVIAGDPAARRAARRIARALGARPLELAVHGPAYHAAAALLANGAAALATLAVDALEKLGFARRDAERASGALLSSVAENVGRVGVPAALTGPVVRGDHDTVARHRAALHALSPSTLAAYDAVQPAVLEAARRAGLDDDAARRIERVLRSRTRP